MVLPKGFRARRVSTVSKSGTHFGPEKRVPFDGSSPRQDGLDGDSGYIGQKLLGPPSVEGWPTGDQWITSGSLVGRVNFAANHVANGDNPGVQEVVGRIVRACGNDPSAVVLVHTCLDVIGPLAVSDETRSSLVEIASRDGESDVNGYPED